jgi:hypothetical protein
MASLYAPALHDALLEIYVLRPATQPKADADADVDADADAAERTTLARIARAAGLRGSAGAWARIFDRLAAAACGGRVLEAAYGRWGERDRAGAAVRWAAWLLASGRGAEALAVARAGGRAAEEAWAAVLRARETEEDGS